MLRFIVNLPELSFGVAGWWRLAKIPLNIGRFVSPRQALVFQWRLLNAGVFCRPSPAFAIQTCHFPRLEAHEILLKFRDPASRNVAFDQLVRKNLAKQPQSYLKLVPELENLQQNAR